MDPKVDSSHHQIVTAGYIESLEESLKGTEYSSSQGHLKIGVRNAPNSMWSPPEKSPSGAVPLNLSTHIESLIGRSCLSCGECFGSVTTVKLRDYDIDP